MERLLFSIGKCPLEEIVLNMKLKTKYNRAVSMVCAGAGRRVFTLEWIEGGFTETVPLAWAPGVCTEVHDPVWEHQ